MLYDFGLGCNTIKGSEQKTSKYAENTTVQNYWPMIYLHEFIQLIHLRENGYDKVEYMKRSSSYIPMPKENVCDQCFLQFWSDSTLCALCCNDFMKEIVNLIDN